MKIRSGFVSNSSSSSFICDICGGAESGWGLTMSKCDMAECVNGHGFHENCASAGFAAFVELSDTEEIEDPNDSENYIENPDFNEDWRHEVPSKYCPICSFSVLLGQDAKKFLMKKFEVNEEQILAEIKETYVDYDSFYEAMKEKVKK